MSDAGRYNEWIYDLVRGHVGRQVVEVGCGIGNMTRYFLSAGGVVAFDLLPESVAWVRAKYRSATHLTVLQGDVCDPRFIAGLGEASFDTVVSINMLEHVEKDALALRHMYALLEEGGYLLLFVPAGRYLYGSLDVALGHYRRYTRSGLARLAHSAGFEIVKLHHVNALGVVGWWANSRLLRRRILPKSQLRMFDRLASAVAAVERRFIPPFGQSLLCIARKPPRAT
jgi:SAM-dependent methyltransferase